MTRLSLTRILWGRAYTVGLVVFAVILTLFLWWIK